MPQETQPALSFTAEARLPQEFIPESLRLQQEIEEDLVASGRNSLQALVFAGQTRFWEEDNPEQRIKLMWQIWDNMIWTPGYGPAYADTRRQVRSWLTALTHDARADYVNKYGYGKMIRDSERIKQRELENLPKRMAALQMRSWVSASRRSRKSKNN